MKRPTIINAGALLGLLLSAGASATELVYTPINPSFGGNPLNGSWLLGNAQAQDDHDDPDAVDRTSLTGSSVLDRFTSQLESRLLSQMISDLGDANSGTLTTDDFIINLINDSGNLTIEVTDRLTGEMSEIIVSGFGAIN